MQVLVLAVQNAVDYADLGVATSGATLFRSIGGSLGTATLGAIFSNRLREELKSSSRSRCRRARRRRRRGRPQADRPPAAGAARGLPARLHELAQQRLHRRLRLRGRGVRAVVVHPRAAAARDRRDRGSRGHLRGAARRRLARGDRATRSAASTAARGRARSSRASRPAPASTSAPRPAGCWRGSARSTPPSSPRTRRALRDRASTRSPPRARSWRASGCSRRRPATDPSGGDPHRRRVTRRSRASPRPGNSASPTCSRAGAPRSTRSSRA